MPTNVDQPSGFRAKRHAQGGLVRTSKYYIASALASNIFRGDPVIPVNTNKRINVAAAGNRLIGVFDGVTYLDSNGDVQIRPMWATGTTLKTGSVAEATVYDDPETLFEIQGSGAIAETDIGNFADVTMATAGVAATGQSGAEVDTTTFGTTDGQLRLAEFVERDDNVRGSANAKVHVLINEHYLKAAMTAI